MNSSFWEASTKPNKNMKSLSNQQKKIDDPNKDKHIGKTDDQKGKNRPQNQIDSNLSATSDETMKSLSNQQKKIVDPNKNLDDGGKSRITADQRLLNTVQFGDIKPVTKPTDKGLPRTYQFDEIKDSNQIPIKFENNNNTLNQQTSHDPNRHSLKQEISTIPPQKKDTTVKPIDQSAKNNSIPQQKECLKCKFLNDYERPMCMICMNRF